MIINPVSENKADGQILEYYQKLKLSFGTTTLPVFFTYLGAFPEYLIYISDQLVKNLNNESFKKIAAELNHTTISQISNVLNRSQDTYEWLERYKNNPSFYNFQNDLKNVSLANTKLSCLFVALREAIKGWAIASKQLPTATYQRKDDMDKTVPKDEFIFDIQIDKPGNEQHDNRMIDMHDEHMALVNKNQSLVRNGPQGLEKNLLPEYLRICGIDFKEEMKREEFLALRVQIEKNILSVLNVFPELIFSPYNVIVELTNKYENFYELLYILSEHFPTLAVQRMMFSGYMIVK